MSRTLAKSLLAGRGIEHDCTDPQLIETHISLLVLLGDIVYKIKKPVDFGFLDFSTLARRKHFCEEEVRLNRRTAPELYLGVVAFCGSAEQPTVAEVGPAEAVDPGREVFEYAVKLRRFDQSGILLNLLESGGLTVAIIRQLAVAVARFHQSLPVEKNEHGFGTPELVLAPVLENFAQTGPLLVHAPASQTLEELRLWSLDTFSVLQENFQQRHNQGHVRECHGDMHLNNLLLLENGCKAFDCIEFNPALRWIDTMSDIAFTIMDLEAHRQHPLAQAFLNQYLEWGGDYNGLPVLRFYLVYRAMVRTKVSALRSRQQGVDVAAALEEAAGYLDMARRYTIDAAPAIILMSGVSGSGKTFVAAQLSIELTAIHIRSDVERKRLFDLELTASSHAAGLDIYTPQASEQTFTRLEELVRIIVSAGFPVIVDATFIHHKNRQQFIDLARELGLPWCIVECVTNDELATRRLQARRGDASEAGLEQYEDQSRTRHALTGIELEQSVSVDNSRPIQFEQLAQAVRRKLDVK